MIEPSPRHVGIFQWGPLDWPYLFLVDCSHWCTNDHLWQSSVDLPVVPTAARTGPVVKSQGKLEWISNFVLVFVAVLGCLGGGTLLALYRIHLLTFISMEFIIVPFILLGESPSLAHLNRDKIESNLSSNARISWFWNPVCVPQSAIIWRMSAD